MDICTQWESKLSPCCGSLSLSLSLSRLISSVHSNLSLDIFSLHSSLFSLPVVEDKWGRRRFWKGINRTKPKLHPVREKISSLFLFLSFIQYCLICNYIYCGKSVHKKWKEKADKACGTVRMSFPLASLSLSLSLSLSFELPIQCRFLPPFFSLPHSIIIVFLSIMDIMSFWIFSHNFLTFFNYICMLYLYTC